MIPPSLQVAVVAFCRGRGGGRDAGKSRPPCGIAGEWGFQQLWITKLRVVLKRMNNFSSFFVKLFFNWFLSLTA